MEYNMKSKTATKKTVRPDVKQYDQVNTKFGVVTVLERKDGKITVLLDDDIIANFREAEFFKDFVL